MSHTPARLRAHAQELAKAFGMRLIESEQLRPEEAFASPRHRAAFVTAITEETTYAVALHELGHLIAPLGVLLTEARTRGIALTEEDAAWSWARHYALEWTPAMEAVSQWAEGTYRAAAPAAPTRPSEPDQQINWNQWK